jgi:hypothetical protein
MANYEFYLASSLEKVFPNKRVFEDKRRDIDLLVNDKLNLQLVYNLSEADRKVRNRQFKVNIITSLKYELFDVNLVKCEYLATENHDRFYTDTNPGLYPDLLTENNGYIKPLANQFKSLWISIYSDSNVKSAYVTIQLEEVLFEDNTGSMINTNKVYFEETLNINIVNQVLPKLPIKHTQWFHTDSIANYHHTKVFSKEHWSLIDKYIEFASKKSDINLLLTPVFTPPLDTDVGGERTTVQLVDVYYKDGKYSFNFDKLQKWCSICKKHGIEFIEVAHLFTQWGAKFTPKIVVYVEDENKEFKLEKKFGWHVSATSNEYKEFLNSFLPSLISAFADFGYSKNNLYFHISDEPHLDHLEDYKNAKNIVSDLLKDCNIIDALSDYSFYEKKLVEIPIPSNDHIEPFVNNVDQLWTYYCIAQGNLVPNRFIGQPSYRNRIMGVLLYLYKIEGFLHWGFNYWESENSRESINPFISTDGNCAFPAGDPFLVYPGPLSSIRNEVQMEAFSDLKLMKLVESKIGREKTVELIKNGEDYKFSFTDYPKNNNYLIDLRARLINIIK